MKRRPSCHPVRLDQLEPRLLLAGSMPVPLPDPNPYPPVPAGEASVEMYYQWGIPGSRTWHDSSKGDTVHADLEVFDTSESVGDGSAMMLYLGAGKSDPGWLIGMDLGTQPSNSDFNKDGKIDYDGICFWFKGDGSSATALIGINWGSSSDAKFSISMSNPNWQKIYMPWSQWNPPITTFFWFFDYSMSRSDTSKANYFLIDKVDYYYAGQSATESIAPTPNVDTPGYLPAEAFVSGQDLVPKTMAKLQARQPVKIVVAGDSIVTATQMNYLHTSYLSPTTEVQQYTYWAQLSKRLQADYGYSSSAFELRTWNSSTSSWYDTVTPRPTGDLQVVAVAMGGWTAANGLTNIQQILDEHPDVVVWEYGANDVMGGHQSAYITSTQSVINQLKAAGIEVVLQTTTSTCDVRPGYTGGISYVQAMRNMSPTIKDLATQNGCALLDINALMNARGIQFVGTLHSDNIHINLRGQTMWADVAEALFAGPNNNVVTWKYVPDIQPPAVGGIVTPEFIVTSAGSLTLLATGVADPEGQSVSAVKFFRDSNGNGTWDAGDALIGPATNAGNGTWTWTGSPASLPVGAMKLFAVPYGASSSAGTVASLDTTVNPYVPGDANTDGKVSFQDYIVLERNFGLSGIGWAGGDFNFDGVTNFQDYIILERNFGKTIAAPALAGPAVAVLSASVSGSSASLPPTTDTAARTFLLGQPAAAFHLWPARGAKLRISKAAVPATVLANYRYAAKLV